MSLYSAYPDVKVYKPLDANEAVEMLFHAAGRNEPVVFSVVRPPVPVFRRGDGIGGQFRRRRSCILDENFAFCLL
jgi:hypothetical protein